LDVPKSINNSKKNQKLMKKKSLSITSFLLLAMTLIITSCSKTGPAGATGATGATGPAGPTGATGATGTANVIYSPWLNVKFTGNDTIGWYGDIPAPKLADSIINHGEIKVYFNAGSDSVGGEAVFPLPIYDLFYLGVAINPYFSVDTIFLAATLNVSSVLNNGHNYYQFRYIIIPGGTTALPVSVNGMKSNTIDWNDYNQVKAYLGLKD
jgi:hypothetical protein